MSTQRLALRRVSSAALATLMLGTFAGCSVVEASPQQPLTGIAACALGKTWSLDTASLAESIKASLGTLGYDATVTVDGTQTMAWDVASKVKVDASYTITSATGAADDQTVVTSQYSGSSSGIAYIDSDIAIPRDWDASGMTSTTEVTLNTTPIPMVNIPYYFPNTVIDDSVGIQLTCDGGALTTHQRGNELTLNWTAQ